MWLYSKKRSYGAAAIAKKMQRTSSFKQTKFASCDFQSILLSEKEPAVHEDTWEIVFFREGKVIQTMCISKPLLMANSDYFAIACRQASPFLETENQRTELLDLHPLEVQAFPFLLEIVSGCLPNFIEHGIEMGYLGGLISLADRFQFKSITESAVMGNDCLLKPSYFGSGNFNDAAYHSFEPFFHCDLVQDCWSKLKWTKAWTQDISQILEAKKRYELPGPIAKELHVLARPIPLTKNCVLSERGGNNQRWANSRYRTIVRGYRPAFFRAESNAEKRSITMDALGSISAEGLILVKKFKNHKVYPFVHNDMCYVLDDKKAYLKCIQYIRDGKLLRVQGQPDSPDTALPAKPEAGPGQVSADDEMSIFELDFLDDMDIDDGILEVEGDISGAGTTESYGANPDDKLVFCQPLSRPDSPFDMTSLSDLTMDDLAAIQYFLLPEQE